LQDDIQIFGENGTLAKEGALTEREEDRKLSENSRQVSGRKQVGYAVGDKGKGEGYPRNITRDSGK